MQVLVPQVQAPLTTSQVWLAEHARSLQFTAATHRFEAGSQVSVPMQTLPPVPPHLHMPSNTSQLVPALVEQSTPAQRVDWQVLVAESQTNIAGQITPPWPPHLHRPSSRSQISGAS